MKKLSEVDVLKAVIREAISDNGLIAGEYVCGMQLTEKSVEVLNTLIRLVFQTDYLWSESRLYLSGKRTYRVQRDETENGEGSNKNTVRSRIYYDITKLKRLIGNGLAAEILEADPEKLEGIHRKLKEQIAKHEKDRLTKQFAIAVPETAEEVDEITEREFEELLYFCKGYSKKRVTFIEGKVQERHMAYLNYLQENEEALSEKQKEELEQIKKYMFG